MTFVLHLVGMKTYIHARLGHADSAVLEALKQSTGRSESELVRRGLQLIADEEGRRTSALALAGRSVGRFKKGPRDLSTNRKHLEGFGE
jgi:Arc/MetJ-type ribon-helix-helix transcriptional regulator